MKHRVLTLNKQIDALVNVGVDIRNIYKEKITLTLKSKP